MSDQIKEHYAFLHCEGTKEFHDLILSIGYDDFKSPFVGYVFCKKCNYIIEEQEWKKRIDIVNEWMAYDREREEYRKEQMNNINAMLAHSGSLF